jgi:transcriptional regulator with XRE-family HTH domain
VGGVIFGGAPKEEVRVLRERAALTVDDLAAMADIDADRLLAIESGNVDPGVSEFERLVGATGHQVITGITRQLREPQEAATVEILHKAVSRLLLATNPPSPIPKLGLEGWRTAALGLLLVARENVRAMLLLDVFGHSYHAAPSIDRSVFEDIATATWVGSNPATREERFLALVQDRNWTLEKLAELDPEHWGPVRDRERAVWVQSGLSEDEFAARLPGFEQRLKTAGRVTGMETWYKRFRRLSLLLHPNIERVEDAFTKTDIGQVAKIEVASDPRELGFVPSLMSASKQ